MDVTITTKKDKDKDKTERERQTFYRVTFKNNCNLLQIADNKANIIISINALLISSTIALIGYGTVSNQIEVQNPLVFIPVLIFLATGLFSTILAVQAAKPKIMGKTKVDPAAEKPKSSVLFFGVSSSYSMEEYLDEIKRILDSKEHIQEQMSISLYYQGMVLNRKYKLLRRAYEVFIAALVMGIGTFLVHLLS
ncbi:MAG: DUF5706 domain-containing protein [Algoriphagus sp.]|nr:DUF5706 domain-containing protein [Algoriphagus sp.]